MNVTKQEAYLNSKLYKQRLEKWHPILNGDKKLSDFKEHSNEEVVWKCDKKHKPYKGKIRCKNECETCKTLKYMYPKIYRQLSKDQKNKEFNPKEVKAGSHEKALWQCNNAEDHLWEAEVRLRTGEGTGKRQPTGCPMCNGSKVVKSNCLETTHPKLIKEEWDNEKNEKKPNEYTYGSKEFVYWICKEKKHSYRSVVKNKTKGYGCEICTDRKLDKNNSLLAAYPDIAEEWHADNRKKPKDVHFGTHERVRWQCKKVKEHSWETEVRTRTKKNGTGCKYCTIPNQSKPELTILFELKSLFKGIDEKGEKITVNLEQKNEKIWNVDIYVKELELVIEYDGSYWHSKNEEIDKKKAEQLTHDGKKVIRIREFPLKLIDKDNDIISNSKTAEKKIVDDILDKIIELYPNDKLNENQRNEIKKYKNKNNFVNTIQRDIYIDKVKKK